MAKNYKDINYFESRPDIVKLFEDLEAYEDFCRFELCEFNPSHLYNRDNVNYRNFMYSQRGPRKPYLGKKPRFNQERNNEQRFSR